MNELIAIAATALVLLSSSYLLARNARGGRSPASFNPPRERRLLAGTTAYVTRAEVDGRPASLWAVRFSGVQLAARTHLQVHEHAGMDQHMQRLGFSDIRLGDADLDERFAITGTDADVVRGALRNEDVLAAILALFQLPGMQFIAVESGASLEVRAQRAPGFDDRRALSRAIRLFQALDRVAEVEPVPSPDEVVAVGTGPSSGAPIGVLSTGGD